MPSPPGGHLVVQDYDLNAAQVVPALASADEITRLLVGTFEALGCDVRAGVHLSELFAAAGLGAPDGTDVAGRIEPLASGRAILEDTFRSVLPVAIAHRVTSEPDAAAVLAALHDDAARYPDRPLLWPLMLAAWKRKP